MQRKNILISAEDLNRKIDNSDVRVIDTRFSLFDSEEGEKAYNDKHIPNAIYANLNNDLASKITKSSGRHPLPDTDKLSKLFALWGISKDTHIIVYDAFNSAVAARLWWLVRWLGHKKVSVLNGGFKAWLKLNYKTDNTVPIFTKGNFESKADRNLIWETNMISDWVEKKIPYILVDARDRERFKGIKEPIDKVAGHIPNAINIPFTEFINKNGKWKSLKAINKIWEKAEINPHDEWGVMCGSGVTACHLSISALLGGMNEPSLYVGSWSEWITNKKRPITTNE
tara:strand:- start:2019 stop:2870 length:852 start_codon:yes stop_codon:yes gene_type:complete